MLRGTEIKHLIGLSLLDWLLNVHLTDLIKFLHELHLRLVLFLRDLDADLALLINFRAPVERVLLRYSFEVRFFKVGVLLLLQPEGPVVRHLLQSCYFKRHLVHCWHLCDSILLKPILLICRLPMMLLRLFRVAYYACFRVG